MFDQMCEVVCMVDWKMFLITVLPEEATPKGMDKWNKLSCGVNSS